MPRALLPFILLSLAPLVTAADVTVTLPLDGYFHPGRYMPVRVVADPPNGQPNAIIVSADESVWAIINSHDGERLDGTIPLMPVGPDPRPLHWQWLQQPGHEIEPGLRPLTNHQKLIGYTDGMLNATDAMRLGAEIYPGEQYIPHALNPAQPLPGTPACWEALDLVLLDATAARHVGEEKFATLIAAGVAFAVRADAPPWPRWPWHRAAGGWWIVHHVPAGPPAATYMPDAYLPVTQFTGGWPAAARWRYVLFGVASAIVLLLLALFRPRYLPVWAAVVTGAIVAPLIYFHQHERPLRMAEGKIRVIGPDLTQDDDWAYVTARQPVFSRNRWVDTLKLVMDDPGMLSRISPRVECVANGDAEALGFVVPANSKIAMLCRRCGPQPPAVAPHPTADSPLQRLAKSAYLRPGDHVLGELPTSPLITEAYYHIEQWPAVVIREGSPTHQ